MDPSYMTLDKSFETRLFINGDFVQPTSSEKMEIKDPNTEELIVSMPEAGIADINKAVESARAAFEKWSMGYSTCERRKLLASLANQCMANLEIFAQMESINMGKPIEQARKTIKFGIDALSYYGTWTDKIYGKTIPLENHKELMCHTRREPIGVAAMIIPWNYPLMLLLLKMSPALACGCTCVIKPSEKSPLTALKFAHLVKACGFPPGVINIVTGHGPSVGEPLARHPDVNIISFTGSTGVGKKLQALAADHVKRIHLEMGGKSPLLVLDDADIDLAAKTACNGLFCQSAGQCCVGSSRILVHTSIYHAFLEKLKSYAEQCYIKHSTDEKCVIGPIVDRKQFDRVLGYIQKGKDEGATIYAGGNRVGDKGYFVEPTIFVDVSDNMVICKEEIFGPVMVVQKFDTVDEAVKRANATTYGLGAGVISRNIAMANNVANRLKAGSVWINTYNDTDVVAPFGGFKQSGIGKEYGDEGLECYLETKVIFTNIAVPDNTFTY